MYLDTLLPKCIALGMTADEFWHSYPKEIKPYFKAQSIRWKMKDEEHYSMYLYFTNAIETALYNAFRGKGKKAIDHLQEPMLEKYEKEHRELTKEEKKAQVALLFANLGNMQKNFEISKNVAG